MQKTPLCEKKEENLMKKTMAMLLSAAMVMSMGLMASAATQDYSVLVDGDKLT